MSEIKDRHDADPDIDYIVAALADDTTAAAAVEGVTEPDDAPLPTTDETIATPTLAASSAGEAETGDEASVADEIEAADTAAIDVDTDDETEADDEIETAGETDIVVEAAAPEIAATQAEIEAVVVSDIAAALEADMAHDAPADTEADAEAAPTAEAGEAEPAGAEIPAIAEPVATMPAVYADTVVEIETADDVDEDDAPLLDDELEHGIASVFAALQSAARSDDSGENDQPAGPLSDSEASDGVTFRLLGELDRLWHRAA